MYISTYVLYLIITITSYYISDFVFQNENMFKNKYHDIKSMFHHISIIFISIYVVSFILSSIFFPIIEYSNYKFSHMILRLFLIDIFYIPIHTLIDYILSNQMSKAFFSGDYFNFKLLMVVDQYLNIIVIILIVLIIIGIVVP